MTMTESAFPLRFDHPLARIFDDPFALPIETGPNTMSKTKPIPQLKGNEMPTQSNLQEILDRHVAEIRARSELTPVAKRARIAQVYKPLAAEAARRDQTAKVEQDAVLQKAKRALFSLPSPTALDNMAHRQALEKIETVDNPTHVANLLVQAKMSNDPTQILAVRQHAFVMSGHGLADPAWAQVFSDSVKGDTHAFNAAETLIAERSKGPLAGKFDNVLVPPSELGHAAPYEVERFINDDPSVAEAGAR